MMFSAREMAEFMGGRLVCDGLPGGIETDSRSLTQGSWFLALVGDRFDGHDFLEAAAGAGCAGAVVDRELPGWKGGQVVVSDTLQALQDLARHARARLTCPVVGLTGSSGKTTTRAMLAEILRTRCAVRRRKRGVQHWTG